MNPPSPSSQSDPDVVIDAAELEAARRDPRVRALFEASDAYVAELIGRGHCQCHLVADCPEARREVNRG